MKEFEKWRKKNDWKWYHYDNSFTMETYMEEAWRAALTWVLSLGPNSNSQFLDMRYKRIVEELNEDN